MKRKLKLLISLILIILLFTLFLFMKVRKRNGVIIYQHRYFPEKENVLLDLKDFKYSLKRRGCDENVKYLHIITSYAGNVESRSAIRRAYPASLMDELGIVRVFLLAVLTPQHKTEVTQEAIINENERFHDLVQGNFIESYKNLTYKHIMGLKWAVDYCYHVNAIIKMDDDILVDLFRLIDIIKVREFSLMGYLLKNMRPIRIKANKWYVTKEEYDQNSYPAFLSGWLYVVRPNTARELLSEARETKFFWIDDLYVTGILAREAEVPLTDISPLFTLHPEVVECCIRKKLTCDFIIAPSGGDNELQTKFQEHTQSCYSHICPTLSSKRKIEDICVSKRKTPKLQKGIPQLTLIKL